MGKNFNADADPLQKRASSDMFNDKDATDK